ncbi:Ubiquitin carboxyl-terminal hydrolase 21 [Fulvia fulva]|uniref:ubiquitinyl hydrolase 1 n=1 Tax=Passalora fulva TaxID=5499 RepID=A0A9Q8PAK8_PASFU|nr:Ubiquitin carboxyl-terminal hydrolase 21 [Fulvia fulva]KAK4622245.1 Ubiquitin carboxyl-terminal hydrolase 21 [Fulvia fulva]KAK4623480.1 Ubiquitin carboxyl-terminal hydrolase 21 [Fulvia fulva]UJO18950.1 Ubiquitin carboxyl-terminal hydrolase 21 [Fulvia fulva]WPV16707.1 Ubiquitin carboxyl-terminal hydrolase 21 [Fulvia fulva]WPV31723.1 Ubiquitin carboxyl-terminal hydrolase 21 [Fulvia fulva]
MDQQLGSDMLLDSDYDEKRLTPNDDNDNVAIISPDDADSMVDDPDPSAEPAQPPADDHEAMMARFMPASPDYETEAETIHTWDITNWRTLPKRTHGPVFHCGNHPWRILFFPAGNSASESVSFYLEQGFGDEKPPEDWYACAQFMLVLHNPKDPSIYLHHVANHRFTAEEGDWGFTRFADKNRIFAAKFDDKDRPLIEDDGARMTAYVRVLKDPTGVLWHNFVNYDSKKETGMVGLRNQGATCYLNSLLQSLYLTGAFRKAVYQIPTETPEDKEASQSAYALQRLFYRLQADATAVGTQELTHSFGWESRQIFEQQDVQELSRILMEKLETRMKGTEAENALNNMFVGKMKTYLKCVNVDYESSRIEEFWDLQLNVSGCKSLDDSFKDYIQKELLEGDNKYAAEGYGLQDAEKGVIFESFPNVLHLQLKRFEYDFQRDAMMKVNDRYEFPEVFDATPYLDETADKSEPYVYHLHGVLVHSGDLNAGHYYAFLKPDKNGEFYRFDDDRVTRATKREAIDENFGGDYGANGTYGQKGQNPYTRQWSTKRSNNAYMLVYVRESRLDQILLPDAEVKPPEHLPAKIAEEREQNERRRKEKEEAHLYMNVHVATETNFKAYQGVDLIPWASEQADDPAAPKVHRLLRDMTIKDFTTFLAEQQGLEKNLVRPWIMVNRQNGTVRPDHPLSWPDMTLQEAADKFSTRQSGFRVFVEQTTRDEKGLPAWPDDEEHVQPSSPVHLTNGNGAKQQKPIILFLKYFDVDQQLLTGVGHVYMSPLDKAQDLATPILEIMKWEAGSIHLELFEEIKQNYIEPMKPRNTLIASEIQDGDIICFQRHLEEAEAEAIKAKSPGASLSAPAYYDFMMNRLFVEFTPKTLPVQNLQVKNEGDERFKLALSKKDTYDAIAHKVAEYLSKVNATPVDPTHLRFTTTNIQSGKPRAVVKRVQGATVSTILLGTSGYGGYSYAPSQAPDHLFYEVLEMSLTDLEQRKNIRITWLSEGITKEEQVDLLVHKQSQFDAVLDALHKKLQLPDEIIDHIRFYEVHSNKVYKVIPRTHGVLALNEFMSVYAERIPEEEKELDQEKGDRLLYCFHFEKEPSKSHGVPFIFLLKDGEVFKETKERISKRTGIKGKNLEKVRFAVIKGGQNYSRPQWVEDEDILSEKLSPDDHLGLEHPNRNRNNWARYESLNIR